MYIGKAMSNESGGSGYRMKDRNHLRDGKEVIYPKAKGKERTFGMPGGKQMHPMMKLRTMLLVIMMFPVLIDATHGKLEVKGHKVDETFKIENPFEIRIDNQKVMIETDFSFQIDESILNDNINITTDATPLANFDCIIVARFMEASNHEIKLICKPKAEYEDLHLNTDAIAFQPKELECLKLATINLNSGNEVKYENSNLNINEEFQFNTDKTTNFNVHTGEFQFNDSNLKAKADQFKSTTDETTNFNVNTGEFQFNDSNLKAKADQFKSTEKFPKAYEIILSCDEDVREALLEHHKIMNKGYAENGRPEQTELEFQSAFIEALKKGFDLDIDSARALSKEYSYVMYEKQSNSEQLATIEINMGKKDLENKIDRWGFDLCSDKVQKCPWRVVDVEKGLQADTHKIKVGWFLIAVDGKVIKNATPDELTQIKKLITKGNSCTLTFNFDPQVGDRIRVIKEFTINTTNDVELLEKNTILGVQSKKPEGISVYNVHSKKKVYWIWYNNFDHLEPAMNSDDENPDHNRLLQQYEESKYDQFSYSLNNYKKINNIVSEEISGTVVNWFPHKNFGFIAPTAGGKNIFFHGANVDGHRELNIGEMVTYTVGQGNKIGKPQAVKVRGNGSNQPEQFIKQDNLLKFN